MSDGKGMTDDDNKEQQPQQQKQQSSGSFTSMDKLFIGGGFFAARYLEHHSGQSPGIALLLSSTTGACIMGLLDVKSTPAVKISSVATVVGLAVALIPHLDYYHDLNTNIWPLFAIGFLGAGIYHFVSSYLVEKNPLNFNSIRYGLPIDDPKYGFDNKKD
jgi:hypothetical protein